MEHEELWVDIAHFPSYAVSNYGTVINKETNHELRQWPDREGQLKVRLSFGGAYANFYVRRLVAEAFFLYYTPEVEVSHKNGILEDNTVLNLTLVEYPRVHWLGWAIDQTVPIKTLCCDKTENELPQGDSTTPRYDDVTCPELRK